MALTRYVSAAESQVWLLDLASGRAAPAAAGSRQQPNGHPFRRACWKRDDSGFFVLSDRAGEFRELMFYRSPTAA